VCVEVGMSIQNELIDYFGFEPFDDNTQLAIEKYLATRYPEAKWVVQLNKVVDNQIIGIYVKPCFKSEEERTFYMLKWKL
jgi:hypothetical protein